LGHNGKRVVLTWAWHPKPLPMAVPNSFAFGGGANWTSSRNRSSEWVRMYEEVLEVISAG